MKASEEFVTQIQKDRRISIDKEVYDLLDLEHEGTVRVKIAPIIDEGDEQDG